MKTSEPFTFRWYGQKEDLAADRKKWERIFFRHLKMHSFKTVAGEQLKS